jgi:hypothetical protein
MTEARGWVLPTSKPVVEGVVVREYKGKLAEATRLFQVDAQAMAAEGYYPVSQVYQPGSWGAGAFIVALLLFLVVIGIFVFIYMLLVKPAGSLVVTYQWRPSAEK